VMTGLALLALSAAALVGHSIGPWVLHPMNVNPHRDTQVRDVLDRTGATKQDFAVVAQDGVTLHGWKVRPCEPNGEWIILFHGVSDNRTGTLGVAEILLRHGYSVVMMDSRAHGESGGALATYGYLERYDTVAITDAVFKSEKVRHIGEFGISMGAAIALQSAAIEPRIEAVGAEDPFANLREVSYDYAGLSLSELLGKTLFRPASYFAMREASRMGAFQPEDVSPEKAVAARAFPVLSICGTRDGRIPCRHAERIYRVARGPKELWMVKGADHASALGWAPEEYESRVIRFFGEYLQ
jgi:alpha-beta hydrolase superfamily lysophospholipase